MGDMRRTVVHGGTLATDYGVFAAHVVVEGGRITASRTTTACWPAPTR